MLRYRADIRTVVFMVVITGLLVIQWWLGELNLLLWSTAMFMAVPASVIAHNHNHLRIWKSKTLNLLQDYWITLFYGFPAFAWIPTHNQNHHKFNNREGDYTITYRVSEKNNLLTLLSYPTISGIYQQSPTGAFLARNWRRNRRRFAFYASQYVLIAAYLVVMFTWDWKKALLYVFLPQQFSLFAVLVFNYIQHVHADEESRYNHSRNYTGPMLNWFLLNNGYHTIHHEKPGLHWSLAPQAHREHLADKIDPRLEERNFWWYILRVYILGIFIPRFRTQSMRLERMEAEQLAGAPAE